MFLRIIKTNWYCSIFRCQFFEYYLHQLPTNVQVVVEIFYYKTHNTNSKILYLINNSILN